MSYAIGTLKALISLFLKMLNSMQAKSPYFICKEKNSLKKTELVRVFPNRLKKCNSLLGKH